MAGGGEERKDRGERTQDEEPQYWATEVRVPCPGCHLPDGDFKDLIEFALEQRCLDTNTRK